MGYNISSTKNLFNDVIYNKKTSAEIRDAMTRKTSEIKQNISTREDRIQKIRNEYSIDAERLTTLVMRFKNNSGDFVSYEHQGGPSVPAGVIANLIQERTMIDTELQQLRKLELVLRNLRDEEPYTHPRTGEVCMRQAIHELDDDELEYLGF